MLNIKGTLHPGHGALQLLLLGKQKCLARALPFWLFNRRNRWMTARLGVLEIPLDEAARLQHQLTAREGLVRCVVAKLRNVNQLPLDDIVRIHLPFCRNLYTARAWVSVMLHTFSTTRHMSTALTVAPTTILQNTRICLQAECPLLKILIGYLAVHFMEPPR